MSDRSNSKTQLAWMASTGIVVMALLIAALVVWVDGNGSNQFSPRLVAASPDYRWTVVAHFSDPFPYTATGAQRCSASVTCMDGVTRFECVNANRCLTVAQRNPPNAVLATSDGGRTWHLHDLPDHLATIRPFSCTSTGWCAVVANREVEHGYQSVLLQTEDLGTNWRTEAISPSETMGSGISCPAVGTCYVGAGGPSVLLTHDGGLSWRRSTLSVGGPNDESSLACASVDACWAYGYTAVATLSTYHSFIERTVNGGITWQRLSFPSALNQPLSMTCATTEVCWASGGHVYKDNGEANFLTYRTTDAGVSWVQVTLPRGLVLPTWTIGCTSGQQCWGLAYPARGGDGPTSMLVTTDGGTAWAAHKVEQGFNVPDNVTTCPAPTICVVGNLAFARSTVVAVLKPVEFRL